MVVCLSFCSYSYNSLLSKSTMQNYLANIICEFQKSCYSQRPWRVHGYSKSAYGEESRSVYNHRDHFLARFHDILAYFCMKSHTNSRSEKKNRISNFSHFTLRSLFFAHAVHFETFGLFYTIGFRIIFAPLFVSYTIAGSFSTASMCSCPSSAEVITHFNDSGLFIFFANILFTIRFALFFFILNTELRFLRGNAEFFHTTSH